MTTAPSLPSDAEIESILQRRIDQEQRSVGIETQFFVTEVDAQITFVRHQSAINPSAVNQLILHQSGQEISAPKLD